MPPKTKQLAKLKKKIRDHKKKVVGVNRKGNGVNINIQLDQSKRGNNSNNKRITQAKSDLQKPQPSIVPVPFSIPFYMPREQPVQQQLLQPAPKITQDMGVQQDEYKPQLFSRSAQTVAEVPLQNVAEEKEPETQGVTVQSRARANLGVFSTPTNQGTNHNRGNESVATQNADTIDTDMQQLQAKLHEYQRTTPQRKRFEADESFKGKFGDKIYDVKILKLNVKDTETGKIGHRVQRTDKNGNINTRVYAIDTLVNARSAGNPYEPTKAK